MIICTRCQAEMKTERIGVYVRTCPGTIMAGDLLTCGCGARLIARFGQPFQEPAGGVQCEVDLSEEGKLEREAATRELAARVSCRCMIRPEQRRIDEQGRELEDLRVRCRRAVEKIDEHLNRQHTGDGQ